jgi:putative transposase
MARSSRNTPGGLVYHVFNRSVAKMKMFRHNSDFEAFERIIFEAHERFPIRILSYCVMSNHWHFVVWPKEDDEVTPFFRWLTHTHAMRWRVSHNTVGFGHLYQGRFKSFPVETDEHLQRLCRYVERNPLTAGLVSRAERWRWSSLSVRSKGPSQLRSILSSSPVDFGDDWTSLVNEPLTEVELDEVKTSLRRNRPLGSTEWVQQVSSRLKLDHTFRDRGRPKMKSQK